MILNKKQTLIAYRCNSCGNFVKSMVGVFSLSGDRKILKCPCGKSHMEINKSKSNTIQLKVPCFVCSKDHIFNVNEETFFERDNLAFGCPYSSFDLCFVGTTSSVNKLINDSNQELLNTVGEDDINKLFNQNPEKELDEADLETLTMINYVLCDLDEVGKVKCRCKDKGEYFLGITTDKKDAVIKCGKCKAIHVVSLDGSIHTNPFLNVDHIELK